MGVIVGRPELRISGGLGSVLEQAWRDHDPQRGFIPSATWRRLRAIKAELAPTAQVVENMLRDQDAARTVLEPMLRPPWHGSAAPAERTAQGPAASVRL